MGCGSVLAIIAGAYLWQPITMFLMSSIQSLTEWWR